MPQARRFAKSDLVTLASTLIFAVSVISAAGVFLYKFYLNQRIAGMEAGLESVRADIAEGGVEELIKLDSRIISTQTLINNHRIISPLFRFLESSTPKTVRFTEFNFSVTEKGPELTLGGVARGYADLALQAELINQNNQFKDPIFSDLNLDQNGNVAFSLKLSVDPLLLSYGRSVLSLPAPSSAGPQATSTPNN